MAAAFDPSDLPAERRDRYARLADEIAAVVEGEVDEVARMATVAAMLKAAFDHYFWAGFYRVDPKRPEELMIGPYQGTLGCLRIAFGRGVCGRAAIDKQTIIVADVDAFADHIACDPRSKSEIVVPVLDACGRLIAVFDVDASERGAFGQADREGLEAILSRTFAA
ncbi:MAG TPA: GAF domain-containing protein [Caulobacteraceae bacterium]|nr:GAF domain-containing protein [Caulobacteraceae bacterium]